MERRISRLVLAAGLALAAQAASGATRPLELKDYYRLETASSPALSPDGRQVAFVRSYIVESENRRTSEIWMAASAGGSPPTRLTSPAFSSSAPRFSPDGKLLAFSSRRRLPGEEPADEGGVWFLRLDAPGGEAFQIEGVGGAPYFSPDNRWIAFTRKTPPGAKTAAKPLSEFDRLLAERFKGRVFDWLGYRSDGRGYLPDPADPVATAAEELYVVPREGGTPRQLTRLGVRVEGVAWRPDSQALAVTADAHQRDEWIYERADLWLVPLEGEVRRLTDDGNHHEAPAFSPGGRTLVFRRQLGLTAVIQSQQGHGAPVDLYSIPAEGGTPRSLTPAWDLLPGDPTFGADGRFVYFAAGVGGDAHLFRAAQAGGEVEQVTRGPRRLGGFSFSSDSTRVAYTAADPTHPAEVFVARSDGSEERRLSGLNAALLQEVELRGSEPLRFHSRDGTAVEGWVILPHGYAPERRDFPLILSIHGGPHGAYQNDFSFQWQLWAARGYAVLYTNPRGSTGYGEKFLWATWGGWGNLDSEDVLAGVDAALEKHGLDPKRLGVYGYSYGGFLTNWLIGHTPRFAAAISGAGVSNWVSDYATSDIPRTKESEFFGPPWEPRSQELLIRQSPVHYAGAVRTPTLFLHGESDYRVPIEQAEQMYLALRKRRVPARFVRYPETSHGGWTPWNMVHRHDQEARWWSEHLGTAHREGGRGRHGNPADLGAYVAHLESPARAEWQKPDQVVEALGLRAGQTACDVGAGPGYFTLRLARAVGPTGRVYAVDVEPRLLDALRERLGALSSQVTPVLAPPDDPRLPDGACNVVLIVDTYHHFPDGPAYLRRLRRALRPQGRLVNIDYEKRPTPVGPPLDHRISREEFLAEAKAAGYSLRESPSFLPHQYFVVLVTE